jgi:V/A-type H+/Na+-transporting ATPase subunit I
MAISQVKKFHIFAHLSIKELLLKELQKLGSTEIIHIGKKTAFHDWKNIEEDTESDVFIELNKVKFCIDFLSPYREEEKGIQTLFSTKKTNEFNQLAELFRQLDYDKIYQQCKELDNDLNHIKLQENRLKAIKQELLDWKELDLDLSRMNKTKYVRYLLGSIAKSDLETFINDVTRQSKANFIQPIKEDKNKSKIVVIGLEENIEEIKRIALQYHFETYQYNYSFTGTPKQIIEKISKELTEITERRTEIEKKLKEIYKNNQNIYPIYDFLSINKEKEDIKRYLKKSDNTFVIKGWIQNKDIPKLKSTLKDNFKTFEVHFTEPEKDDQIPVALENNKLVKPFEVITELYSLPNYHEIDPTPILSIFYFIFFGFCLSDVGYGAVLAFLSYLAMTKLALGDGAKKFFKLLYYCGIAGIFGGIIMGSWFGDILDYLPSIFRGIRDFLIQKLALFDPTDNPIPLLILSLSLGVIQVYTGIILKYLDNVKKGKLVDGLMDQISWLVFLTGIILVLVQGMIPPLLGKFAWFLLLVGALSIVLTGGRANKNFLMKIGSGILSLYDITGYFSDVLSYSRLFALGLATGIIAKMFNMLATMANVPYIGIFLTLIVLFIGHVFNLLISGLSAFIHDARLQYVEFFTKFYKAGGVAFKPFSFKPTYTKIEESK